MVLCAPIFSATLLLVLFLEFLIFRASQVRKNKEKSTHHRLQDLLQICAKISRLTLVPLVTAARVYAWKAIICCTCSSYFSKSPQGTQPNYRTLPRVRRWSSEIWWVQNYLFWVVSSWHRDLSSKIYRQTEKNISCEGSHTLPQNLMNGPQTANTNCLAAIRLELRCVAIIYVANVGFPCVCSALYRPMFHSNVASAFLVCNLKDYFLT